MKQQLEQLVFLFFCRNYSGAPYHRSFKPARVAQVRFSVLNEQVNEDSESKALLNSYRTVVLQAFCTHLNSYLLPNINPAGPVGSGQRLFRVPYSFPCLLHQV